MHQLHFHEATKRKGFFPQPPEDSLNLFWNISHHALANNFCFTVELCWRRKMCLSAVYSHYVWLWTCSGVCRGREACAVRARVRAAETQRRKRPVVNCRRRGKQQGVSRSAFEKRTSQGRFQLAQHVVSAVSHGGRGAGGEAASGLGKEKRGREQVQTQPRHKLLFHTVFTAEGMRVAFWELFSAQNDAIFICGRSLSSSL